MLLHTIFSRSARISYKHSCCSWASALVAIVVLLTILVPYLVVYYINADLWTAQLLHKWVYEQPRVAFTYRYLLVAEFGPNTAEGRNESAEWADERLRPAEPSVLVSSSYPYYNEVTEKYQRSIAISHWTEDRDHDRRPERIHLQFTFPPPKPNEHLHHLSLYLDFDADLLADNHCAVRQIPTALILQRVPLGQHRIAANTAATWDASLRWHQLSPIFCPFTGRSHQETVLQAHLIPVNSTDYADYDLGAVAERLQQSVAQLEFKPDWTELKLNRDTAANLNGNIALNIRLQVPEMNVRFRTSVLQQLFAIWMEILAVLVVTYFVGRLLLAQAFRRRWVRAWEVVPWKKLY